MVTWSLECRLARLREDISTKKRIFLVICYLYDKLHGWCGHSCTRILASKKTYSCIDPERFSPNTLEQARQKDALALQAMSSDDESFARVHVVYRLLASDNCYHLPLLDGAQQ